jgi:hypothetical protein
MKSWFFAKIIKIDKQLFKPTNTFKKQVQKEKTKTDKIIKVGYNNRHQKKPEDHREYFDYSYSNKLKKYRKNG